MKIEIGTLATVHVGSDRYAAKVVSITPKTIYLESNGGGNTWKARIAKDGSWRTLDHCRCLVELGVANEYMDPSF